MANKKYFYTAAIVSFGIYFTFILLFLYHAINSSVQKVDSFTKNTVLQLDIVMEQPQQIKNQIIKSKIKSTKKAKEVVKKTSSSSAKKRSDLKSLFSKVDTKAPKVAKKVVTNTKKSTISSRFKSRFEKERKTKDLKLNKLQNSKTASTTKQQTSSSKNNSDPYYSKIYDMMYKRWNPVIFDSDSKAKVLVTIKNNGTFSFQFIQYSNNISFDNQLKKFLSQQLHKKFPVNPNGKTTQIEILFQAKG